MTPATLRAILTDLQPLGLSARRLAALWGYASDNSIRQMLAGKQAIPPHRAEWLLSLHAWWISRA